MFRARTHREFVHVRLADHHGARAPEVLVDVAVVRRDEVLEDFRGGGCARPAGHDEVLHGDGDARQWRRCSAGVLLIGFSRLLKGELGCGRDVGVNLRLDFGHAVQYGLRELDGRDLFRPQLFVRFVGGQPPEVAHSSTARTRT